MNEFPNYIFLPAKCDKDDCLQKGDNEPRAEKSYCMLCGVDDERYVRADPVEYEVERIEYHFNNLLEAMGNRR